MRLPARRPAPAPAAGGVAASETLAWAEWGVPSSGVPCRKPGEYTFSALHGHLSLQMMGVWKQSRSLAVSYTGLFIKRVLRSTDKILRYEMPSDEA